MFPPLLTTSTVLKPLSFTTYAAYVLVPYVGHLLIAEDLGITPEEAYKVMMESAATGAKLHVLRDDDEHFDDILRMNVQLALREKNKV
jgi:hypothetical protein